MPCGGRIWDVDVRPLADSAAVPPSECSGEENMGLRNLHLVPKSLTKQQYVILFLQA
jgi:hypothetical protein